MPRGSNWGTGIFNNLPVVYEKEEEEEEYCSIGGLLGEDAVRLILVQIFDLDSSFLLSSHLSFLLPPFSPLLLLPCLSVPILNGLTPWDPVETR
jgi:hypothetical protein